MERGPDDLPVPQAHLNADLPRDELLHGRRAEPGREEPVVRAGRAAALDVAEDRDPEVEPEPLLVLLEVVRKALRVEGRALGDDDDRVLLAALARGVELAGELLRIDGHLGHHDGLRTARDAGNQREI